MSGALCVLTGASGGIGQAFAKMLHDQGWSLLLVGRNKQALEALNKTLPNSEVFIGDLTDEATRVNLAIKANQLGGTKLLINNAGINVVQGLKQTSSDHIDSVLSTNLLVPIKLCQLFLQQLESSKGIIVNVGSSLGSIGYPYHTLYCASKFGLRGFTEALSRELNGSGVNVTYLAPRATDTSINNDQTRAMNKALGNRMDTPERVAKELLTLINSSKKRRFIGFPEKLFVRINGAFPGIVDGAIGKQLSIIKRFLS
ncbi:SDR family oxidoreductase [Pseudoalteromonas sp. 10-33]|jgi:short-subunit dehydrogenase|uniref:SDR family oxidoreductase n=1 Tax=Pseudoalteromonas sp. 10-33 TaxID=1761890 RepID=UPI0007323A0B|nr:SDR family oxidoreductase [Pseudoalteromonas sp. 10-33]KTF08605.1 oxidoreductase [Pseudoalteromonas sp. 10-33]